MTTSTDTPAHLDRYRVTVKYVDYPAFVRDCMTARDAVEATPETRHLLSNIMATLDRELADSDGWRLTLYRNDNVTVTLEHGACVIGED